MQSTANDHQIPSMKAHKYFSMTNIGYYEKVYFAMIISHSLLFIDLYGQTTNENVVLALTCDIPQVVLNLNLVTICLSNYVPTAQTISVWCKTGHF